MQWIIHALFNYEFSHCRIREKSRNDKKAHICTCTLHFYTMYANAAGLALDQILFILEHTDDIEFWPLWTELLNFSLFCVKKTVFASAYWVVKKLGIFEVFLNYFWIIKYLYWISLNRVAIRDYIIGVW